MLAIPKFQAEVRDRPELKANSFSGRCLADFDAKDREHLRRFSVGKNSRDTEGSNLLRSASQSLRNALSPDKHPPRLFKQSRRLEAIRLPARSPTREPCTF